MLFDPTSGLPLLICPMGLLTSFILGRLTFIGRFVGAASILSRFIGVGLFKSFSKGSAYPFCCSWISAIGLPYLSFTDPSALPYFPADFFVVSYSCFIFPPLVAFSAIINRSYTYFRQSALILMSICLFASVHSARALALSLIRLLLNVVFMFSHSWTLYKLSAEIH